MIAQQLEQNVTKRRRITAENFPVRLSVGHTNPISPTENSIRADKLQRAIVTMIRMGDGEELLKRMGMA